MAVDQAPSEMWRTYPHWLADRVEVPLGEVVAAAEELACHYPWDDPPPSSVGPSCWQLTGSFVADLAARIDDPLAAAVFAAMIGLAIALGGLAVYLLLLLL